jgi:eukaryotic-like serine/threonine-protein kinase
MTFLPDIDLYLGRGDTAYDAFVAKLPALRATLFLHLQFARVITNYTRGRCAISSLEHKPELRNARLAEARRCAVHLRRERQPWATTMAATVEAAAQHAAGDDEAAIESLRSVIEYAAASGMAMHAIVARHRLGKLLGGEEGAAIVREAHDAMSAEGIRRPERWLAVYLPGRWDVRS